MATVLTNVGKGIVTNRIKGAGTEPTFIGWGTGVTTAAVGDTTLTTAATEPRTTGASTRTGTNSETYTVTGTITVAGTGKTIAEAGLFDTAGTGSPPTGGQLFIHGDHAGTALAVGESIAYTISVTFA
jgi:hypothetical protein